LWPIVSVLATSLWRGPTSRNAVGCGAKQVGASRLVSVTLPRVSEAKVQALLDLERIFDLLDSLLDRTFLRGVTM